MFNNELKFGARRHGVMLAFIGAISMGLMACSEKVAPPLKQEVVTLTPEQEFAALLKKAEAGDADAQTDLGYVYITGKGVPKDAAKAVEWYQKAAAQGNAWSQHNFGLMYLKGEGVPKDASKAVEWFQKAATQGNAGAQYSLGSRYDTGEGVPEDAAKAVEWFQKAATQGNADAQYSLGSKYDTGKGVPKDAAKALEWFLKAAAQGNAGAQTSLGWRYADGEGVSKDVVLAYAWINLAIGNGATLMVYVRDLYEARLSSIEKAEAQRLSSNWKSGQILIREGSSATASASTTAPSGTLTKQGNGTAFIVSKSGQAITNHHVIDGCKEVSFEGRDGVVKVSTSDVVNDVALLQVTGTVNGAAPINSDTAKLRQGDDIVVYGFPLNSVLSSGGNLTPGVVSALTGLGNNSNQIQITAPIQPGSSGSPVLNNKGEVVGVVSMKLSDAKMAKATGQIGQNVNFAVGGQTLKSFLDAHKVDYATGGIISFNKSTADLADEARKWTTVVECWK